MRVYLEGMLEYSVPAIERSVRQFTEGKVDWHGGEYAPSLAQLSRNVRAWHEAILTVTGEQLKLFTGILEVDFGGGRIDMRGLTVEQQEQVFALKALPPGMKREALPPDGLVLQLKRMP